jgi:hypothetical protein
MDDLKKKHWKKVNKYSAKGLAIGIKWNWGRINAKKKTLKEIIQDEYC